MAVMIGIDPHKRSHTAVALDGGDAVVGQLRVTRWSATIAVSIPIVVSVAWECIEGSSHEHTATPTPRPNDVDAADERFMGEPSTAPDSRIRDVSQRHPTHARPAVTQATHACELMRCPSRHPSRMAAPPIPSTESARETNPGDNQVIEP